MHTLRNPKWIFLISTVPVVVLLLLGYGEFSVVRTLLPGASVAQWQWFGAALGLLGAAAAGYAGARLARRQPLGGWYSVAVLLAYSLWLCLATTNNLDLLPREVPRWMVPTDPVLMAWTFLMPTLAHALLALVARFTPDDQAHQAAPNLAFAGGTVVAWVVVFQVMGWLSGLGDWPGIAALLFVAGLVLSTLSFFFFLVRALFIVTQRRGGFWEDTRLVWKIIITTALPLAGLGVNNGLFFGQDFGHDSGIFGNFGGPWFYGLALLNGVLLCLPDSPRRWLRGLQLLGRSVLFGYTLYFFLMFLPFLPLSIPAIVLVGTGFLLLAPTLLFVVHVRQLSEDVAALRMLCSRAVAVGTLGAGVAVLPLGLTAQYWHDRQVLHEALADVTTPDYAHPGHVDAVALDRTLAVIRQNKDRNFDFLFGSQQPYLSTYYNWLVLDNLMLSDTKIDELARIFTGSRLPDQPAPGGASNGPRPDTTAPRLRAATARSTYDTRQQAWVSWVSLEIANPDPHLQNGEYRTVIALPPGCWVSDYYLTIGHRQERGILAEKKAATWVFAQILNENRSRDPGLLAYRGPNDIAVRVYPVMGAEVRRTRIQFLHKEPCVLTVDGRRLALGDGRAAPPVAAPVAVAGVTYLSGRAKRGLPLVRRRPYYHFLLDASAGQGAPVAAYRARIARQLARPLPNGAPARFSLVNAASTPVPAGADWAAQLARTPPAGGYYLSGAIRRALFAAQEHPAATYPVLVAVTDRLPQAVLAADFEDFRSAYPESEIFYVLKTDGRLEPHSLRHEAGQPLDTAAAPGRPVAVRAWPSAARPRAYLPDTDEAAVVPGPRPVVPATPDEPARRWATGLLLRGYGQWQSFHPETTDRERVPFIQASFRAGILTPFTSYLALENDAQKAALRRKQAQTLAANASLDAMETDEEPPTATPIDSGALLLAAAGLALAFWYLRRCKTASVAN